MLDCPEFGFDLHNRDHVKLVRLLVSFRLALRSIRRILLNLIDDHVKHVFEHVKLRRDHVKLCSELPCLRAITSNIAATFPAHSWIGSVQGAVATCLTMNIKIDRKYRVLITEQVATAPCTDPIQVQLRT